MTATTVEAEPQPREYSHRQIQVVMSGLMLGVLLAALDQTIVSTALTRISQDFHRPDLYSWVVTSYLLTSTASTPLYGKISDLFGRKTIFQFAIVLFLIGSALCGLSQNMIQLILFRGVQGLGAGGLISLALAIVGDVIPPRQRGRYQGYFGAVFGASSVLGPLIGGFLVDSASWRYVFYVNIPVGIVALVVIQRVLQLDHTKRDAKVDVIGALLLVAGVSLFLVAVQNSGRDASVNGTSWLLGSVGLVLVVLFVLWETRASEPILPLRLFGNSVFRVSSLLSLITGAIMFGAIIFLPQYMQLVRGISPTKSGLHLLPLLAGLLLTSIGSGRLISRIGRYKIFVVAGTAILAVGLGLLTLIEVDTGFWEISGIIFVVGFGLGLFMQTLVLATQNAVDRRDLGVGTSAVTFFRTLGGALGASVLGAVLIASQRNQLPGYVAQYGPRQGPLHAFTHGMTTAYFWAIPIALVAFVLSFFLRDLRLASAAGPATPDREPGQDAAVATVGGAEQSVGDPAGGRGMSGSPAAVPAGVSQPGSGGSVPLQPVARDRVVPAVGRREVDQEWRPAEPAAVLLDHAAASTPGAPRPVPAISGRVTHPDGSALAGAVLTLTDLAGGQLTRTRSDEAGAYRLLSPDSGRFLLVCVGGQYEPDVAVLTVAEEPVRHDVALRRATSLRGLVRQSGYDGGLAGAVVTLADERGQVVATDVSDASGCYTMADLIAGSFTLTAAADRHRPVHQQVVLQAGAAAECDIELVGGGELSGRVVVASTGQPLPGAAVAVLDGDGTVVERGLADATGRYAFRDLPPGSYTVTASGYAPITTSAVVVSGLRRGADLPMGPGGLQDGQQGNSHGNGSQGGSQGAQGGSQGNGQQGGSQGNGHRPLLAGSPNGATLMPANGAVRVDRA